MVHWVQRVILSFATRTPALASVTCLYLSVGLAACMGSGEQGFGEQGFGEQGTGELGSGDLEVQIADHHLSTFDVEELDSNSIQLESQLDDEARKFILKIIDTHRSADRAISDQEVLKILTQGVIEAPPVQSSTSGRQFLRLLQLELLVRYAESAQKANIPGERLVEQLQQVLRPDLSLPLDKVAADALIRLGGAAESTGQDALAMASYRRAIDLMTRLSKKIGQEIGEESSR